MNYFIEFIGKWEIYSSLTHTLSIFSWFSEVWKADLALGFICFSLSFLEIIRISWNPKEILHQLICFYIFLFKRSFYFCYLLFWFCYRQVPRPTWTGFTLVLCGDSTDALLFYLSLYGCGPSIFFLFFMNLSCNKSFFCCLLVL